MIIVKCYHTTLQHGLVNHILLISYKYKKYDDSYLCASMWLQNPYLFHYFPSVSRSVSVLVCQSKLTCREGHSGPTYESMKEVFALKAFRPAVNLSNPTITNISFTLYAVLGVVSNIRANAVSNLDHRPHLCIWNVTHTLCARWTLKINCSVSVDVFVGGG